MAACFFNTVHNLQKYLCLLPQYNSVVCTISVTCGQGNGLCHLEEKGSYCSTVGGILVACAVREDDGCLKLQTPLQLDYRDN